MPELYPSGRKIPHKLLGSFRATYTEPSMPETRSRQTAIIAVLVGLVVLCLLAMAIHKPVSYDVWWQIKSGEWILEHGVPQIDPFSYAYPDGEWIETHWLYDIAVHLVFEHLGFNSLILLKSLFIVLACAFLFGASKPNTRWAALLGIVMAIVATQRRFFIRPEVVTWACLTATLCCLHRFRASGRRAWIFALPAVQILWCNVQALWVLGPVVQWIFFCSELVTARWSALRPSATPHGDPLSGDALRSLFLAAVASTGATIVNPYFLKGAFHPFSLFAGISQSQTVYSPIAEFLSPLRILGWDYTSVGYVAVVGLSLLGFALNYRRTSASRVALWLAFFFLSTLAQRNIGLFGLVAGFTTILNLSDFAESHPRRAPLAASVALVLVAGYSVTMLPLVVTNTFYRWQGWDERFGLGIGDRRYPIDALAFVEEHDLPRPVFNTLSDGGYVLFEGGEKSVFFDGRLEVYGRDQLYEAINLSQFPTDWDSRMEALGVRVALVPNEGKFDRLLGLLAGSPDWVPVYFDHLHIVFLRVTTDTRQLAEQWGIDWRNPVERQVSRPARLTPAEWPKSADGFRDRQLGILFVKLKNLDRALAYFESSAKQDPRNVDTCLHLGLLYSAVGKDDESRELLARVPEAYFRQASTNRMAGQFHVWGKRPVLAAQYYQKAIEIEPGDSRDYAALAEAAWGAGQPHLELSALEQLLSLQPDNFGALTRLGAIAANSGQLSAALEYYRRAGELEPDRPEILNNIGAVLAMSGRVDAAKTLFERVLEIDPDDEFALDNLGRLTAVRP